MSGIEPMKGIIHHGDVVINAVPARLLEDALKNGEGIMAANGALAVRTGKYTGRSPRDRYIVDSQSVHQQIDWGPINQPIAEEEYQRLFYRLAAYLQERRVYIFDGYCGAHPSHRVAVRIVNQYAWQNLFIHQLLIRPTEEELESFVPEMTVICAPGFQADPAVDATASEAFVMLHLEKREIIIGGTHYAGEIKKAIFTTMNYLLTERGICPMHCSANRSEEGQVALFFGLSGTGKTTLSANPSRRLIGDDEHGWADDGVFNMEGGCYAKCIHLSREHEPQIWEAIRCGSVLENVVLDEKTRYPDYDSDLLTENSRAAYPVDNIPNAVIPGIGGHPDTILFLTADAFGVLPPIAHLTTEQAIYYFLSGYTSKLAGTERGITSPQATFSTGFGEPFLPRFPQVYADLLRNRIVRHQTRVYLVNTGWTQGPYGIGRRIHLPLTRAMVRAAVNGDLSNIEMRMDPHFGFAVPLRCPDVPQELLDPRTTWTSPDDYDRTAQKLADDFRVNFQRFCGLDPAIRAAGPVSR